MGYWVVSVSVKCLWLYLLLLWGAKDIGLRQGSGLKTWAWSPGKLLYLSEP